MKIKSASLLFSAGGLAAAFLLSACDPAPRDSDRESNNPATYTFKSPDAKTDALKNWNIACASASECPENIGQLVADVSSTEVSLCTAFLLGDQKTIATNNHCITDLIGADAGGSLVENARIIFPKTNSKPQLLVRVSRVISTSKKAQFTDPDLALLELEVPVTDRAVLSLDRSGLNDQELLKVAKVNPASTPRGLNTLEVQTCRVVVQPFFLTTFQQPKDPTVAFTDCEVLHGNSGSPMMNSRGDVKAVLFGTTETTEQVIGYGYLLKRQTREPFDHPELRGRHFNYATNATCFSAGPLTIDVAGCRINDLKARDAVERARNQKDFLDPVIRAGTEMSEWAVKNSKFGVWTMEEISDVTTNIVYKYSHGSGVKSAIRAKLACIQPISNWGTPFKKTSVIHWNPYVDLAKPLAKVPRYFFKLSYDPSLRTIMKVEKDYELLTLKLSPSELSKDKGGSIEFARTASGAVGSYSGQGDVWLQTENVKACGAVVTPQQIRAIYFGTTAPASTRK